MKKISKYKINNSIIISMILFFFISIISIISAQELLPSYMNNLAFKQTLWYITGFILSLFIMFIGNNFIYDNIWKFYIINILLLLFLLIFGTPINNAKCWFDIKGLGTFQPSEFMKIILIVTNAVLIDKFNQKESHSIKDEFRLLIKIGFVVFIPSFLTFLQPDTGVVLIYLLITLTMLFISGIRYRWFITLFIIFLSIIIFIITIYFTNNDLFINIFGTDFFLRIDRLLDWSNKSGFQLENGLTSIGSSGFFGYGFKNTPLYFPEPQTDFIFAVYASNFGFLGTILLLGLILFFDIKLISIAIKSKNSINKYVIAGIIGMLIYQQLQNIGMTFGLMPITGITLPFISYGGSSLLSYMIMAGIIFNISNERLRYKN